MDFDTDEQKDEIQALQSIFMDEFKEISSNMFEIAITPTDSDEIHMILKVEYPENYPSKELPIFNILPKAKRWKHQRNALEKLIIDKANEQKGEPVIYTVVDYLKEYISSPILTEIQKVQEIEKEVMENLFLGTPVTAQNFDEWNTSFLASIRQNKNVSTKKTGKEIFNEYKLSKIGIEYVEADEDEIKN